MEGIGIINQHFVFKKNLRTSQNVKFVLSHFVQLAFQQGRSGTHIDTNCLNEKQRDEKKSKTLSIGWINDR